MAWFSSNIRITFGRSRFLSINTIGGLSSSIHHRSGEHYIGYVNYLPKSARREGKRYSASDEAIKRWASEQLKILENDGMTPLDRSILAYSLCHFCVDQLMSHTLPSFKKTNSKHYHSNN